ncbi:MAG: DUF1326 domain-containing protein [Rhodospirillaceae bacterium]|jgi:hypothetical protein|nr:DUF1326 domain-containing protein [Rhodospirillaceae bacterium]MBT5455385.1 DUF1326 domain-containing protein [Rhodospirillaceae bacterium]
MAYVDWKLHCVKIGTCNCPYGCPCEFMGLPVHTHCNGVEAMEIVDGYFGDVRLDGLRTAGCFYWPGPVHEGKGTYVPVIDKRATEEQVEALFKILGGEEQEPTTVFNIYGATIDTEHDPIFAAIDFACDVKAGTGHVAVDGVLEATLDPIKNAVTGEDHRAIITLPTGFEFRNAEVVSGGAAGYAGLKFDYKGQYGSMWEVTYGPYGIVE